MFSTVEATFKEEQYVEIEANLLARFVYLSQSCRMRLYIEPEMTWFTTDIAYPHYVFNIILRANLPAPEMAHAYIDKLLRDAQDRHMSLFWAVGPATQPADLGYYLQNRGLTLAFPATAMHLNLDNLNGIRPKTTDFRVVRVETLAQLEDFITVQAQNSQIPDSVAKGWYDLEADIGLGNRLPWQRYLGYWHDEPVATASTVAGAGVVGLYQVGTLPQARGFGLGTAISQAAMEDARRHGHRQAILHSTPMALNVYRRLGFEPVTNVDIYQWSGPN